MCGHLTTDPLTNRLNKCNFVDKIPATGRKTKHQSGCAMCSKGGI